jgi:amino acid transporter
VINKPLRKELSRLDLTMASLGAIIGSGWLFGVLYASADAGPASIISWVIGGIAVLLIGLVYAELGGMMPETGGIARYPHFSHGNLTGFIMGWAAWIAYASVPAIEAEAVAQYASHWVPGLWNNKLSLPTTGGTLVAAALVLIFFIINYYGVRLFARVNTTVTFVKFIMPAATIIIFLIHGLHYSNLSAKGFAPYGTSGILQAVATSGVIFAYLGFRQAVDLAGEAKDPQRDVPRAVITAIGIGIILYVLLQFVFLGGVSPASLVAGWAKLSLTAPFAQVAVALNLGWFAVLLYADAVVSPAGTGNVYIASTARVIYALAHNQYLPKAITHVDEQTGIPRIALVIALLLGWLFLLPFPAWEQLVGLVSSATVFTYIIGPVSAQVFRRTYPDARRPYTLGGMSIIAPIAFVIGSLIVYWTGWNTDWKLLVAILVGVVLYFVFSYLVMRDEITPPDGQSLKAGLWLVVYLLVLLGESYFGSAQFGAPGNVVRYPWDLLMVIVLALVFYYWGVASGIKTDAGQQVVTAWEAGGENFPA